MIERCIFIVCLDSKVKSTSNKENIEKNELSPVNCTIANEKKYNSTVDSTESLIQAAYQMLHGCNSENNSGNRWFDKTMQFIISEDGYCGINYEHSPAEGIVVIELSEHLFRYL